MPSPDLLTHVQEARSQAFGEVDQRLIVAYKAVWEEHVARPAAAGQPIDLKFVDGFIAAMEAVAEVTGLTHDDVKTTLAVLRD